MRIVHVLNEVVDTGNGIVNATVDLACTQARQGHDVSVISSGGQYVELLARHNVSHHTVRLRPRPFSRLVFDIPRLRRIVRKLRPNIVHAHMMTGAVLLHLGRLFAGFGRYGLVTTVHNEWRRTSWLMRVGDRVLVLSEKGKEAFVERGFPHHKLRVVSHGIVNSPRRERQPATLSDPGSTERAGPVIVTVAGMYFRKGIGDLINAFALVADEFPRAVLKIAGWGPAEASLKVLARNVAGGERIAFLGFVAQPHALLRGADIFVLASHTESFPLALAEAREAGCAVIGTQVGGIPELLEQGHAGLLVAPHDIAGLAETLRRLLKNPDELSHWRNASQIRIDWLSCERMERETMDVYQELLANCAFHPTLELSSKAAHGYHHGHRSTLAEPSMNSNPPA